MEKRELKESINKHGGFVHISVEGLKMDEMTKEAVGDKKTPEGAKFFSGIASNADLNRNGYIIILEAWRKSIKAYMENPVVLLGHDMRQPIGRCTKMEITPKGLYVEGYVYDEYTDGRVGKGLITTLSTGHYTKKYDFLNLKTGQIISKQDFRRQWDAFWQLDETHKDYIDNWVRRITETEIVEFSFVSIPANRKSHVTVKESLQKWYESTQSNVEVAKTTESVDNLTVTKTPMKNHVLTKADLESYPTLAEKYSEGEEINAEAWEAITGEKLEAKEVATEEKPETTVENADEKAAGEAETVAETPTEEATTVPETEEATVAAENAETPISEEEVETKVEAENAETEEEATTEKVVISTEAREQLKKDAEEALAKAEKLKAAYEGTTDGTEEEAPVEEAKTEKPKLDVEALQGAISGLVEIINTQQEQIGTLTKALENVPAKKGLILHSQFGEAAKTAETAKETTKATEANTESQLAEISNLFAESGVVPAFKQ